MDGWYHAKEGREQVVFGGAGVEASNSYIQQEREGEVECPERG